MPYTATILDEVRARVAPDDDTLKAAKGRRDDALGYASVFNGVTRTYVSGSIAHGTANSGLDADGGIVLDRRTWKTLGPDGDEVGPSEVVEEVRQLARTSLKETYPEITTRLTKRAIVFTFHEELPNGLDPSVDLIVGLQRADGGLWIPNLESDTWDASDPIRHTELLTADPKSLRVTRARIVRLAKCWNSQYSTPGMCSFNIEALALACIEEGVGVARGLAAFFEYAVGDVGERNTPDPAEISKPIKLKVERDVMVDRLKIARGLVQRSLENDDDESIVCATLADLFWKHLDPPAGTESKAALAQELREGNAGVRMGTTLAVGVSGGAALKTGRAYGSGAF
jgi:hypothetical protein